MYVFYIPGWKNYFQKNSRRQKMWWENYICIILDSQTRKKSFNRSFRLKKIQAFPLKIFRWKEFSVKKYLVEKCCFTSIFCLCSSSKKVINASWRNIFPEWNRQIVNFVKNKYRNISGYKNRLQEYSKFWF